MTASIKSDLTSTTAAYGGSINSELPQQDASTAKTPWLGKVQQGFVKLCWANQEIKVWSQCDRSGNVWWSAYNPMTDELLHQVSEDDMRRWLESRNSVLS